MDASFPDPHYSDHTNFATEFFSFPFPIPATWTDNMIGEQSSSMSSNNAEINYKFPSTNSSCDMNSPVSVLASFPETFGVSDCMAALESSEFGMGFRGIAACDYKHQIFAPGEEFMLCPAYHMAATRGIQTKREARVEDSGVKVGRYSVEERKSRILRYLQKRNQRNFNKTIKYACRKTLADKRVRVRGRFAKNKETCDNENALIKNTSDLYCYDSLDEQSIQMKYGDDDWLEVAVASLAYSPYISG